MGMSPLTLDRKNLLNFSYCNHHFFFRYQWGYIKKKKKRRKNNLTSSMLGDISKNAQFLIVVQLKLSSEQYMFCAAISQLSLENKPPKRDHSVCAGIQGCTKGSPPTLVPTSLLRRKIKKTVLDPSWANMTHSDLIWILESHIQR